MVSANPRPALHSERRETRRFTVNLPLTVSIDDCESPAYTRDLSNRGVYFYLQNTASENLGQEFDFVVELPPEITLSTSWRIRCRAKLMRRDRASKDTSGIAAEILNYRILHQSESESAA